MGNVRNSITVTTVEDGADAISIVLSTEHYAVACLADGTPKTGEIGAVLDGFINPANTGRCYTKVSVYRGNTLLVKGTDWNWASGWDYSGGIEWGCSKPVTPPDTNAFGDTVYITKLTADSGYLGLKVAVGGNTYTKYFRFNKLKDGATGSDAYNVVLTNEVLTVACNTDGSLKTGELAKAVTQIQVYKGNTLLTWNTDWRIDETVDDGATFTTYQDTVKLAAFNSGSNSGTCDIAVMIGATYIYKTFSVAKVIDGQKGDTGATGPLIYPAGMYDPAIAFSSDGGKAPVVLDGNVYYKLKVAGPVTGISPTTNPGTWEPFNMLKYVFTEVIFANFGKLASAVFSGDYMFSQYGKTGAGVAKEAAGDYAAFDPNNLGANSGFIPNLFIDFLTGFLRCRNVDIEGKITATDGSFSGALSTPFIEVEYTENSMIDLGMKSNITTESYVTNPLTLTLPTDLKYNGREIAIYNKGMTSNSTVITILTGSGSVPINKLTLGIFKAVLALERIIWVRIV